MNWSSPFPYEESQINMLKKKARPPKLVSARQLQPDTDNKTQEDQYQDFDKEREREKEKEKEKEKDQDLDQYKDFNDNELGDYNPPKDKLKNKKMEPKNTINESYNMYQNPFADQEIVHTNYPVYDKPFEYTPTSSKDAQLLEKLNYMIYLLEEQKDEKTGQVTEELILYVFLGVFVLFVLDSFFKTGKYSR